MSLSIVYSIWRVVADHQAAGVLQHIMSPAKGDVSALREMDLSYIVFY